MMCRQWFGWSVSCITLLLLIAPNVCEAADCDNQRNPTEKINCNDSLQADDKSQAPYLLSESERVILKDDRYNKKLRASLERVFDEIIGPGSENSMLGFTESMGPYKEAFNYFVEAATYHTTIDQERYVFGSTFQRHAGFHNYFTAIDLKTGEVIIASSMLGELKIAFKACVSEDFKRYANHKIHKWLYDTAMESVKRANGGKLPPDEPPMDVRYPEAKEFSSECK